MRISSYQKSPASGERYMYCSTVDKMWHHSEWIRAVSHKTRFVDIFPNGGEPAQNVFSNTLRLDTFEKTLFGQVHIHSEKY